MRVDSAVAYRRRRRFRAAGRERGKLAGIGGDRGAEDWQLLEGPINHVALTGTLGGVN